MSFTVGLVSLVVGFLAVALPLAIRSQLRNAARFRREAASLGFSPSPVGGAIGSVHVVGTYQGVPAILAYSGPDGDVHTSAGRNGVLVTLRVAATGPGIELSDAGRFLPGSETARVIAATWPSGWEGPVAQHWLPLSADRRVMRAGLEHVLAHRGQ